MLDLKGRTLVLPVISVGSVPQLAMDLLIHSPSLECECVARLDGAECVPFVAPGEGREQTVYTALDGRSRYSPVYQANASRHVFVQQRSPVLKVGDVPDQTHKAQFTQRLMSWIQEAQFADVLLLATVDAGFRTDAEFL